MSKRRLLLNFFYSFSKIYFMGVFLLLNALNKMEIHSAPSQRKDSRFYIANQNAYRIDLAIFSEFLKILLLSASIVFVSCCYS